MPIPIQRLSVPALVLLLTISASGADQPVSILRLPPGGMQPVAAVAPTGAVHLVWLSGKPDACDVYYARVRADGSGLTKPIRVNSQPGSAIAVGSVRGAQIAVGRNGRVHIAWMGSSDARPRAGKSTPMLYARMTDDHAGFEPQRNLITRYVGLDGGGSVAADASGHVYVTWHAPRKQRAGEESRAVWVARSDDDGRTFSPETAAWDQPTGSCACCGMKAFCNSTGSLFVLYRSATDQVHRDIYLLRSDDGALTFTGTRIAPMELNKCMMSTEDIQQSTHGVLGTWETDERIYWGGLSGERKAVSAAPPGRAGQKHSSLAVDRNGRVLLAWAEGTGWEKGGDACWAVFDAQGRPVAGAAGRARDLPVWDFPAAACINGRFLVIY